jgi:UDP-N-acetylglucosamine:LPS N-acetylglucosamine transferase
MKLVLVASSGGHLQQLLWMRAFWEPHERVFVTFDTEDARAHLVGERWIGASHPTQRHVPNLARNLALARRVLAEELPDAVVTTGAGVGVPFVWEGWRRRVPTVFVETFDRIRAPSLSGRLVSPVVDLFVVQRELQLGFHPRAVWFGPVR